MKTQRKLAASARYRLNLFDSWLDRRVKRDHHPLTCAKGCFACCDLSVAVSWAEACLLRSVISNIPNGIFTAWVDRVVKLSGRFPDGDAFLEAYRSAVGTCPFLGLTGECGIYAFRPLSCRMLVSELPSRYCGRNYTATANEAEHRELLIWQDGNDCMGPWLADPVREARKIERILHQDSFHVYGVSIRGALPVMLALVRAGAEPGMELPYSPPILEVIHPLDAEKHGSSP